MYSKGPPCALNLRFLQKNKLSNPKIFLSILIQGYLERPNTVFDLIYVLLLRIGRQGKTLIEKGRRDSEK